MKDRLGVKLTKDSSNRFTIHGIKENIDYGCQIEYTRVRLKNNIWFTFCLEWFGEPLLEINPGFINDIIVNSNLKEEDSFSYSTLFYKSDLDDNKLFSNYNYN